MKFQPGGLFRARVVHHLLVPVGTAVKCLVRMKDLLGGGSKVLKATFNIWLWLFVSQDGLRHSFPLFSLVCDTLLERKCLWRKWSNKAPWKFRKGLEMLRDVMPWAQASCPMETPQPLSEITKQL